jgi:D-psicose/D-tagatose/L-ribulose 3-epimerase
MKFGVHSFIWTADFSPADFDLLPRIKEGGFDGVELPLFEPRTYPAAEIRKGLEEHGLACTFSVVIPAEMSLIAADLTVRTRTREYLTRCIEKVAETGAKLIVGPMYSPVGHMSGSRRTEDEWKRAVEGFQSLAPVLESCDVTMALEPLNRFETYFLNTAADVARLCEEVASPRVGALMDTFHANIEEKDVAAAFKTAGRHLKHVHTCENDRGTPGTGHVPWMEVFAALKELRYDGWLTIESFGFSIGGISAAASIWRDLASTPDEIAFEGVKFLKKHMA